MTFLAGDVGATKTALALVSEGRGGRDPVAEAVFPSRDADSLEQIVTRFLTSAEAHLAAEPMQAAAFGVAGPVIDGEAKITNLNWTVAAHRIADVLKLEDRRVALLNDLVATATAIPHLLDEDIQTINTGVPIEHAPIAVLAPGTGLGQAYLTWDGTRYRCHASEGGHVDFAPCDRLQLDLLNYLYRQYDHVSFERVVSGQGIPGIYHFLKDTGRAHEPAPLASALLHAADPTPLILASSGEIPICRQTLDVFVTILGAKAGNVALSLMSRGGVYLGGGIPPRILPSLKSELFWKAFSHKGRFTHMMKQIPVRVITNPRTALLGATRAALSLHQPL